MMVSNASWIQTKTHVPEGSNPREIQHQWTNLVQQAGKPDKMAGPTDRSLLHVAQGRWCIVTLFPQCDTRGCRIVIFASLVDAWQIRIITQFSFVQHYGLLTWLFQQLSEQRVWLCICQVMKATHRILSRMLNGGSANQMPTETRSK